MTERAKIAAAFLAAQKELGAVVKSSKNPHFKSNYADISAVLDTATAALHKHGISVTQGVVTDEHGHSRLRTTLLHESGEHLSDDGVPIVSKDPANPQAQGGAITYARRYGLAAMVGLRQEDDDANAASTPAPKPATTRAAPKPTTTAPKAAWAAKK